MGKAVVRCCEVGPDALVELWINAHVGRFHPVAPLGFLAEQGARPLGLFAQTNALAFELLAELQRGADGQITRLGVLVGHRLELHGFRNSQAVDHLSEGFLGALPKRWRWGDGAAIGKEHRMDGWLLVEPAEQLFRIAGAFADRWLHRFGGVGLQRLRRGEALDVLGVVRVEVAGLIPHKADHGHIDAGLVQFLQQPITEAAVVFGRPGPTQNV